MPQVPDRRADKTRDNDVVIKNDGATVFEGEILSEDGKKVMIRHVIEDLAPIREKQVYYGQRPAEVAEVVSSGNRVAQEQARQTMAEVHAALTL